MISKYSHKKLNWVDIESPKEEELLHVIEQYSVLSVIKEKIIVLLITLYSNQKTKN